MSKEDLVMCAGVPVEQEKIDYCEATFTLKDGIVKKITYHGRTGGLLTKDEQCAFIIENCLKR